MTKDTVIGIGVGVLVGWLLWRRRQGLAGLAAFGAAGGCCGGCAGASPTMPGACANAFSAGLGSYAQGSGPVSIPNF